MNSLWWQDPQQFFSHKGILVHRGFFKGYLRMQTRIITAVNALHKAHPGSELFITGHSLGAALATVTAADLVLNHHVNNVRVVTFGSPRVFNKPGAQAVSKAVRMQRVVQRYDPVPHMPPCTKHGCKEASSSGWSWLHNMVSTVNDWFTGDVSYWHVSQEVWATNCTDYKTCGDPAAYVSCDSSGEDPLCSDSVTPDNYDPDDHLRYLGIKANQLLDDSKLCPKPTKSKSRRGA